MTREEAKEIIDTSDYFWLRPTEEEYEALNLASDMLEKDDKRQWIPVSDKLPKEYEEVLCWYEYYRYGDYNCMYQTYGVGFYGDGYWGGDVRGHKLKVFAWMPLPEPYKGAAG